MWVEAGRENVHFVGLYKRHICVYPVSVVMERYPFVCRTKALVLELLAAICLVKGGHEIILSAFDNFKEVCHEIHRFHTLMDYFINYQVFHLDFMVTTWNCIL